MKAFMVLVLALMLCESIEAASLLAGGYSKHLITSDQQYNNDHDMAGVQLGNVMAVRFNNSYGRESYAVGYQAAQWSRWDFEARVYLGGVVGYDVCAVCPVAVPAVVYDRYFIKPGLIVLGEAAALYVEVEL